MKTSPLIHDVLEVKGFTRNIASVSKLISGNPGTEVTFTNAGAYIIDRPTGTILGTATLQNGLYILDEALPKKKS